LQPDQSAARSGEHRRSDPHRHPPWAGRW
jgi:hypothetical protein